MENTEFTFNVVPTSSVTPDLLAGVQRLFAENYRDANLPYLDKALHSLAFLSTAATADGTLAGFALAEARVIDLPRAPATNVHLHGLSCVGVDYRRHGLFRRLEAAALSARRLPPAERYLACGRTAHPASFRFFFNNPGAVPRYGRRPTQWQRDVGSAIAQAYGSPGFDPEHFVVKGSGTPIGWPVIQVEASPEEWEMFKHVDRAKGDSLLGVAWSTPPDGWLDDHQP